jgi:riboflavin-specific deaminase-like protein
VEFRQLIPDDRVVDVVELLGSVDFAAAAGQDRPHTIVNFVASADGRATFQGRSGKLGDEGDRAMFHGLRSRVDAVFAGTGTMRTERYGRMVRDPERRKRREQAGLAAEPLAVVMSRRGDIPISIPLFAEPEARIAVFVPAEVEIEDCPAEPSVVKLDPGELTLTTMLRRLRDDFDVHSLLCEGGPAVFSSLLLEGLVDELFLTLAPKLTGGGTGPTLTSGPELTELAQLRLVWALERHGSLFLRYALRDA